MVAGATAEPLQPEAQIFNDVPLDVWYARWVNAAYHAGIIQPCSEAPNLQFCPNKALTRAEAAYMLAHAKGWAMP
jgi:hypothetical protein